jgi:hypothetical protein
MSVELYFAAALPSVEEWPVASRWETQWNWAWQSEIFPRFAENVDPAVYRLCYLRLKFKCLIAFQVSFLSLCIYS